MVINFFNQGYNLRLDKKAQLKKWLQTVAQRENKTIGDLNYIFTTDDYLSELNKKYLQHDTLTDIITFDYSHDDQLTGDIFISAERVKENAQRYKVSDSNELNRVMVHGLLHLAGYGDKTEAAKAIMRKKEDEALSFLVEK